MSYFYRVHSIYTCYRIRCSSPWIETGLPPFFTSVNPVGLLFIFAADVVDAVATGVLRCNQVEIVQLPPAAREDRGVLPLLNYKVRVAFFLWQ